MVVVATPDPPPPDPQVFKNAQEPSAVVVAVPPFAAGMTPVIERVVVLLPPEVEIVDVIFPEPRTVKLIVGPLELLKVVMALER